MSENTMKTVKWYGHEIRFVKHDGEWWAILKDICDALDVRVDVVVRCLTEGTLNRVLVNIQPTPPKNWRGGPVHTDKMTITAVINEIGIYEVLLSIPNKNGYIFKQWTAEIIQKLRIGVGLGQFECFSMTDEDVQDDISGMLDQLYVDTDTGELMMSVTARDGDVEQIPYFDEV